jgi:hypothetical protein
MSARGVHTGEILGIPPTHKEVSTDGIAIHRVRDGKIVEYWSVVDVARLLGQMGVLPGPPTHNGLKGRGAVETLPMGMGKMSAGWLSSGLKEKGRLCGPELLRRLLLSGEGQR